MPSPITYATDQIIDSPEGGTANVLHGDPLPTEGYWVGGGDITLILTFAPGEGVRELLESFLYHVEAVYVGWWTDAKTGKLYVDVVNHLVSLSDARLVAADRGEIAFWDIENDREIRV